MFDAEKLSAARWSVRDILQYLKNNHRVKRTHVEKAVRCLNEAGFEVSAKMLEAEFRPVFQGKKITTELSSSIQSLYDGVDAAISVRMNDEAHAIISQRRINQQTVANSNGNTQSDGGLVMPSSKPENPTKIDNNFDAAHVREQLQHFVKMPAFRLYVKEQITQWELWHRSHTEEIREHEGLRDKFHQELKELQDRDLRHSDDPADFDPLSFSEHCYELHRDVAAGLKDDPEYKLVADREPVIFKEASVAAIVALFWCDVNHSTLLVPEYDFLEPEGPFIEHVRKQWRDPIDGRYIHIDWMVQAAVDAYARKGPVAPQAEESVAPQAEESVAPQAEESVDTADEIQEDLAQAESSHPVPEQTTLKQPSGSGDADAESKGEEAVEPETTESTTTEQKKVVMVEDVAGFHREHDFVMDGKTWKDTNTASKITGFAEGTLRKNRSNGKTVYKRNDGAIIGAVDYRGMLCIAEVESVDPKNKTQRYWYKVDSFVKNAKSNKGSSK